MLYIFDKDDNMLEIIEDYSDDKLTRDIKGTFTFSFKYEVNVTENIKKRNKVGFFIDDEKKDNFRLFIIDEVEECYFNDEELYVYCINDYYSLKDNVIVDKRCDNYTCEQTLEKVLENTSYVLGDTINLGTESLNFYYVSSLEAFNNTRETYGFEFDTRIEFNEDYTKIANKYIDIKYHLGQDTGLRFTYDTNLTKVKRIVQSENHYNVLYGRGASLETDDGGYTRLLDFSNVVDVNKNKPLGQKYVEDIESIAKYGRIEGIYENKDTKDDTELLNVTWDKLQETKDPQITYEAEAEDIRDIEGFEHYNANLGDSIIILDEDYKLDYESRIIKDVMSIKDKTHKITLGYILPSMTDSIGGIVVNSSDKENIKVNDTNFPYTLPPTPILSMDNEGFATISLSWTFENKSYYTYILYASQLENFNPTEDDIIWQGQGSSFLHEVNFNETWYYRIRAKNTHNQYTEFSSQVTGTTYKISDATQVFEDVAIKDALIGDLKADRGWIGKFKGDYIDAKNLSVTDGSGNKTLDISSAGDVDLNVRSLKIQNDDVATSSELQQTSKDLQLKFSENGGYNLLYDGDFSRGEEFWIGSINKWFLNGNSLSSDGKAIGVQNTSADVTAYVQQYVENENLINAPKYTISAYVNLKDGEGTVTETSEIRVYCRITYDDDTKIYENIYLDLTKVDEWYRISKTFERDMTKKVKQLSFSVSVKNTTYILFVSQAMLNVGNLIPWSHNPNEVCDGVTKIDKDGITVTASNVNSKTSMSADGFKITKTDTNEDVFKVNSDGRLNLDGIFTTHNGSRKSGYFGSNMIKFYNWWQDTNEEIAYFFGGKTSDGKRSADVIGKDTFSLGIGAPDSTGGKKIEGMSSILNIYSDTDFNDYKIKNLNSINEDTYTDLWVSRIFIRNNQINNNIDSGNLWLNYWRGYNSPDILSEQGVYVGNGNNDGSYGRFICGDLKAYGTKNATVQTDVGYVGINAYETADYYFGDIGETILDDEGYSYVYIDSIFAQTVNTNRKYQVFLTVYGEGVANVIERHPTYFIIKGSQGIEVGYEIKAKRKGYEDYRLEREVNSFVKGQEHGLDIDYNREKENFNSSIVNKIEDNIDLDSTQLVEFVDRKSNEYVENEELLNIIEESVLNESIN